MKLNKVTAIYFSPTGNSKKSALAIAGDLSRNVEEIDITKISQCPESLNFGPRDFTVIAAPVYGGRLYKGFVERIKHIRGGFGKCVAIVTYGNRHYDDAIMELRNVLIDQNFIPIGCAALVGRHTYGEIQTDRPNYDDFVEYKGFARDVLAKIESGRFTVPAVDGNIENYKEGGNGGSFRPLTSDKCVKCGICAMECPEEAISFDDFSKIDDKKCISCFRCIRICPVGAKNMDTEEYNAFASMFSKKLRHRRENEYFI